MVIKLELTKFVLDCEFEFCVTHLVAHKRPSTFSIYKKSSLLQGILLHRTYSFSSCSSSYSHSCPSHLHIPTFTRLTTPKSSIPSFHLYDFSLHYCVRIVFRLFGYGQRFDSSVLLHSFFCQTYLWKFIWKSSQGPY
jgi:hypothetical protein